jgi:hypothetical protein
LLDIAAIFELRVGETRGGVAVRSGEQRTGLIHDSHARRGKLRNARRDEMHDGLHLRVVEPPAGKQLQHHRRARLALLAQEHRLRRQREMHARGLHGLHRADRARELGLHRAHVHRVLHERGLAERAALGHLVDAEARAARQAGGRELHADFVLAIGRHEQAAAVGHELVGDLAAVEQRGNLAGIAVAQARIELRVLRALRPEHHGHADRDGRGEPHEQQHLPQRGRDLRVERQCHCARCRVSLGHLTLRSACS